MILWKVLNSSNKMDIIYDKSNEEWENCIGDENRKKFSLNWMKEGSLDRFRHERMLNKIKPFIKPNSTWLTLGDGRYGTDANFIIRNGGIAHASDISDKLLEIGHRLGFINEYSQQNAEKISFDDESFDYVLIKEAFHHFPRPWIALHEAFRVCKKGVILIEPRDPALNGNRKRLFNFFKNKAKILLKKNNFSNNDNYRFEEIGNFVYSINPRELEKFLLGMHFQIIAFSEIDDVYIRGGELVAINSQKKKDKLLIKKFNSIIQIKTLLKKLKFLDTNIIFSCLFKEYPDKEIQKDLRLIDWQLKKLPINPYI